MAIKTYKTDFGPIRKAENCKSDYENLVNYTDQPGNGAVIILQAPALKSLQEAEERLYALMHPLKAKARRLSNKPPAREPIIVLAGSKRTCELQEQLWESDPSRFAHPNSTLHTHGLAIDVSQAQGARKLRLIRRVLSARDWHQSRWGPGTSNDEPWHYSFHLTA